MKKPSKQVGIVSGKVSTYLEPATYETLMDLVRLTKKTPAAVAREALEAWIRAHMRSLEKQMKAAIAAL